MNILECLFLKFFCGNIVEFNIDVWLVIVIIDSILPFIYMIYINEKEVWVEEAYINALFLLVEKPREFMLGLLSKPFTIYYSSPIN